MKHGDLSNQLAPAILVDADLLVQEERRLFRTRLLLRPGVLMLMHYMFTLDLSVYVGAVRDSMSEAQKIQEYLDKMDIPYTKFYWLDSFRTTDELLRLQHVYEFLISDEHPERKSFFFGGKGVVVNSISQALNDKLL